MTSKGVFVMWWGSRVSAASLPDIFRVVILVIQALQFEAIIWIGLAFVDCCIFVVILIVVFVLEPFREIVYYLWIGLRLDPSLEVPDNVLIVQAAEVCYLAANALVLFRIELLREQYLLDGVYISIEAMSSLIYNSEAASTNFL